MIFVQIEISSDTSTLMMAVLMYYYYNGKNMLLSRLNKKKKKSRFCFPSSGDVRPTGNRGTLTVPFPSPSSRPSRLVHVSSRGVLQGRSSFNSLKLVRARHQHPVAAVRMYSESRGGGGVD